MTERRPRLHVLSISEIALLKRFAKTPILGGIEVNHKSLLSGLRGRGHSVIEGQAPPPGWKPDVIICPTFGPIALINIWWKKKKYGCACVQHAHTTPDDMEGGFLPKAFIPYVGTYLRLLYRFSEVLITPSNFSKAALMQLKLSTKPPIVPVSNGVNLNEFRPDEEKRHAFKALLKDKFGIDPTKPVILGVGVIWERKGIDIFHAAAKARPQYQFVWVGSYITTNEIVARYNDLPNMTFTGFVEDVVAAYCGSDVFFFPSRAENQGIPLLEAAACELPIVCRDLPTYDWMEDGVHCLKGKDTSDFLLMIYRVLSDASLRDGLIKAARDNVQHHAIDNILDTVEGVYRRAVKLHDAIVAKRAGR